MGRIGFKGVGLTHFMRCHCSNLGLQAPTGVQSACIPEILAGENVIANSPTGTGKTLAFVLPIVQKCSFDPHPGYSLTLTPTRELALQVADQFRAVCASTSGVVCVTGGVDYQEQAKELHRRPQHIVATPGRLADHFENNQVETKTLFRNLKFLVIDEADRVLGGDFDDQLKTIMDNLPRKDKQTLFFSATVTDDLRELAKAMSAKEPFMYNYFEFHPDEVDIDRKILQKYVICPPDFKEGYLMQLLLMIRENKLDTPVRSMMIFVDNCQKCGMFGSMMTELQFPNVVLHSQMSHRHRREALAAFKSGQVTTMVATDLASRGLDIKTVDLVINYDLPCATDYIHRLGRVGRAGQEGLAISLLTNWDLTKLAAIEGKVDKKLVALDIPHSKVLGILNEVYATKRSVCMQMTKDDQYLERQRIYKRKREILNSTESEASTTESDDAPYESINNHIGPKAKVTRPRPSSPPK